VNGNVAAMMVVDRWFWGHLKVDEAVRVVAFHLVQGVSVADALRVLLLGSIRVVLLLADLVQSLHPDALHLAGAAVQLLLPIHVELARDGWLGNGRRMDQWMTAK